MSTAVIEQKPKLLEEMAHKYGVDPANMFSILKNTVIKPSKSGKQATNEEVQAFLIVANKYGLNPFTREIYAFESNGAVVPIVGVDGWATLVNRQEHFDGCKFETQLDEGGKLVSISCAIYHKMRMNPVVVTEFFDECKRGTIPWNTMPKRMLRHKAFMQCARLAFGLSGLHDEDEAHDIVKNNSANVKAVSRSTLNDFPADEPLADFPDMETQEKAAESQLCLYRDEIIGMDTVDEVKAAFESAVRWISDAKWPQELKDSTLDGFGKVTDERLAQMKPRKQKALVEGE